MKWYPKGLEGFLGGDIAIDTDTIKCVLVSSAYTQNDAHNALDDVAAGRLGTSGALASKTITDGVFDCADFNVDIDTDGTVDAAIFYKDTGTESTSLLIGYIDEDDAAAAISKVVSIGDTVAVTVNASGVGTL